MEYRRLGSSGLLVSAIGLGCMSLSGIYGNADDAESIRVIHHALDKGVNFLDSADMYGWGHNEELLGKALPGIRDKVFIVSKVYPHNASRTGAIAACERSLKRLKTNRIDLYLLHWRGSHPLADTVAAFEKLKADGKIRHWGVSNFDIEDMAELRGDPTWMALATRSAGKLSIGNATRPWARYGIPLSSCRGSRSG